MLECGKNFKGTMDELCKTCKVIDNENHRLNDCPVYKNVNLVDSQLKVDFKNVFSNDMNVFRPVIKQIEKIWDVHNAHGSMKK